MLLFYNIIDVVIILLILAIAIVGLKRGVILQTVMSIGTLIAYILAFYLSIPLSRFFNLNLPYFKFIGSFKNITVLNIMLYRIIAFILILVIILIALNIIIKIASKVEKILKFTIVLGIPSKILGFVLGLIEGYVLIYILLFIVTQPNFNMDFINESKLTPIILNRTPILSNIASQMNKAVNDIYNIKDNFQGNINTSNLKTLDIMLQYNITTKEEVMAIKDKGKLNDITNIESILEKY